MFHVFMRMFNFDRCFFASMALAFLLFRVLRALFIYQHEDERDAMLFINQVAT